MGPWLVTCPCAVPEIDIGSYHVRSSGESFIKKPCTVPLFLTSLSAPVVAQVVTSDKMPPNSGCYFAYTYPSGFNLSIAVSSLDRKKETEAEIERTLALDISRFMDTGLVRTQHDELPLSGKWLMGFQVTVFWSELMHGDKHASYLASLSFWEECAIFGACGR